MGKKVKQKRSSSHSSKFESSDKKSAEMDDAFVSEILQCDVKGVGKLTISCVIDEYKEYLKCIKTNFKNLVLLHPSILRSCGISDHYIVIYGERKTILCIAYPIENIKKSLVLFVKDSSGFREGDSVTVSRYMGKIHTASEVIVSLNTELTVNQHLKDCIFRVLCNKFVSEGMTFDFVIFGCVQTLAILKICYVNQLESKMSYSDAFGDHTKISDIYSLSSLSLEEPRSVNVLSGEQHFHPTTSTPSNRNKLQSVLNRLEDCSDCNLIPEYFLLTYTSKLTVQQKREECENILPGTMEKIHIPLFTQVGGLNKQLNLIRTYLEIFLTAENNSSSMLGSMILLGSSGTGKTLVLNAIKNECNLSVESILWYDIYSKSHLVEKELEKVFQRAINSSPSIILLDEFNYLCPGNDDNTCQRQVVGILTQLVETLKEKKVLIIAAANTSDYNGTVLKASGRLLEEIQFNIPTALERTEILKKLLDGRNHNLTPEQIQECGNSSHAFTGKDLSDIIFDAVCMNVQNNENCSDESVTFSCLKKAMELKKPTIISASDVKVKKVQWQDIGGMMEVKEKLKQLVEWPFKYPDIFKRLNSTPPRGILLYGPPGCSKTMIAKALATECELNFISKNASELFHKYVGESEKAVQELFTLAKAKSPCIIFLDEIDALVAERGSCSDSGVGNRIVTTLLTEIDGIEELHGVIVIAATNRPDVLDHALIRSGRISQFIYVPLPDIETRKEILKIQMKKRIVSKDFNLEILAQKTESYTGAEIVNICNEAAFHLLAEDQTAQFPVFQMHHFEKALISVRPRTSKEMIELYETFNLQYCIK